MRTAPHGSGRKPGASGGGSNGTKKKLFVNQLHSMSWSYKSQRKCFFRNNTLKKWKKLTWSF
jgi:hypothetical protein